MRSGKCKSCGEESVYRHPSTQGSLFGMTMAHKLPVDKNSYAVLTDYVCSHCGFAESFLEDPVALAKIAASWEKVV